MVVHEEKSVSRKPTVRNEGTVALLYIDDEPDLRLLGQQYLEKWYGFEVTTAESAENAISILKERSFDAIVSDYEMTPMNGVGLLKHLKTSGDATPFILLTGKGGEDIVIEALNAGVDFYLQKGGDPKVQFSALAKKIRYVVSHRRSEKKLLETQKQIADIIDFLPDATFAINTSGMVIAWNRAMEAMTGIGKEEILNTGDYGYALPFYHNRTPMLIDLAISTHHTSKTRYTSLQKVGDTLTADIFFPHLNQGRGLHGWGMASPLYDSEGNISGAIESIRDITHIKDTEHKLSSSLSLLNASLESTADGLLIVDRSGNITRWNQKFVEMWQIPSDLLSTENPDQVLSYGVTLMTNPDLFLEKIQELYSHPDEISRDILYLADGRIFERYSQPQRIDDEIVGRVWSFSDITELKQQEEHIRQYSVELEKHNKDLEKVREELAALNNDLESRVLDRTKAFERLLAQKDLFLDMMGHDLKTPLTPLCALLPLLLEEEQSPQAREMIAVLIKNATQIRVQIEKVLNLARLTQGSPLVDLQDISVKPFLDDLLVNHNLLSLEKRVKIKNQVDEDLTLVMNELHLETVLSNIIENAIKYSGVNGEVIVTGKKSLESITLIISDSGIGMTPDEIDHIFDAFYRADSSRHARDSHGLGLSIVKKIVDLYEGEIYAESEGKGMGSRFIIQLPNNQSDS